MMEIEPLTKPVVIEGKSVPPYGFTQEPGFIG
jgi:hypothetical protein